MIDLRRTASSLSSCDRVALSGSPLLRVCAGRCKLPPPGAATATETSRPEVAVDTSSTGAVQPVIETSAGEWCGWVSDEDVSEEDDAMAADQQQQPQDTEQQQQQSEPSQPSESSTTFENMNKPGWGQKRYTNPGRGKFRQGSGASFAQRSTASRCRAVRAADYRLQTSFVSLASRLICFEVFVIQVCRFVSSRRLCTVLLFMNNDAIGLRRTAFICDSVFSRCVCAEHRLQDGFSRLMIAG